MNESYTCIQHGTAISVCKLQVHEDCDIKMRHI